MDAASRTLARATERPTGRPFVTLTVGDRTGPALNDYPSVTDELIALGAVPTCPADTLSASVAPPAQAGPGDARELTFGFQNRSEVMCRLAGFPRLTLLDAAGERIPISIKDQGAAYVRQEGIAADTVLDPDQSASFTMNYTRCRRAPAATQARVALPGVKLTYALSVGSSADPVAPCSGTVEVSDVWLLPPGTVVVTTATSPARQQQGDSSLPRNDNHRARRRRGYRAATHAGRAFARRRSPRRGRLNVRVSNDAASAYT
ncbi:MAG: DUF4232 domain-containing protein [Solirubrobacteraceae bacterium]